MTAVKWAASYPVLAPAPALVGQDACRTAVIAGLVTAMAHDDHLRESPMGHPTKITTHPMIYWWTP